MTLLTPRPPTVYYTCSKCKSVFQNPEDEDLKIWLKEHDGHRIKKDIVMNTILYDLGYNDLKKAEELAQIAKHLDAVVADIRFAPHTRNPEFSQEHLVEVLGDAYIHIGELGNKNYKGEGATQFVDKDAGLLKIARLLTSKSVIMICACWKRADCHRLDASHEYEVKSGIASTPITRADARKILEKIKADQDPQIPLF